MANVFLRPLAEQDLLELWLYLSEVSFETADATLDHFHQKMEIIAQNPQIGQQRPELGIPTLRSFPTQKHTIFYLPLSDGIDVLRVLHNRRDLSPLRSNTTSLEE